MESRISFSLSLIQTFWAGSAEAGEDTLLVEIVWVGVLGCECEDEACLSMLVDAGAFDGYTGEEWSGESEVDLKLTADKCAILLVWRVVVFYSCMKPWVSETASRCSWL